MKVPECLEGIWCDLLNTIAQDLSSSILVRPVDNFLAPAAYFKDPEDLIHWTKYLIWNDFLPYLNNERWHLKAGQYKQRILDLNKMGLVMFNLDQVVYPKESEFFQEFGFDGKIIPFNETRMYRHDQIGLRTLDEQGRLQRWTYESHHLSFTDD